MNYKIIYKEPTRQYISIEAYFSTTGKEKLNLQFPAWRPGRYELGNFAKNIRRFSVSDSNGKVLSFNKTGKDAWEINCNGTENITVSYSYFAAEINAGSSYIDDDQLYVNPVNCLIYNPEEQHLPCELELELPKNFEIACGACVENNTIKTSDFHELVDSPFIAGSNMQHKTYSVFGIDFHLWIQGQVNLNWNKIIQDFEAFTKTQIEKFSDRKEKFIGFPVKSYHFLFQILPYKAYHGVEHQTSTVISLGPATDIMDELYDDFLGVSSHELYHTWNIKAIRPEEMYPYDYAKENFSHLGYVAEGVTTYLGDVFLAESGVKPFGWYKKELEKLLQRHFDNFGRFNYSVAESSWDTWLDGYVKGAPFRKVSIYNEGALISFALDMKIRKNSNNSNSLHDVMNKLYLDFALKNKGYTETDYKTICESFANENLDAFFNDFIHGTNPYESILVEALEAIGFTLEMSKNPDLGMQMLGIRTLTSNDSTKILEIFPGSSAELGQLMVGDEILALNEIPLKGSLHKALRAFTESSLTLKVNRLGRIFDTVCPNTNRSMYPIYTVKKSKAPSNLNKRIFKKWIGSNWDDV